MMASWLPAPHVVAQVQACINQGLTYLQITALVGVSEHQIARMRRRGDIVPRKRTPRIPAKQCRATGRVIPTWVSRDYRADYRDNLALYGEEHALRLARRAHAEARGV